MRLLGVVGPILLLLALVIARASGDEALHRLVSLGVIATAVLGLVLYAIVDPAVYRDAWRAIQPDALAASLAGVARRNVRDDEARVARAALREHMAFFGCPINDLTDEELDAAVMKLARVTKASGISTNEVAHSLQMLEDALRTR